MEKWYVDPISYEPYILKNGILRHHIYGSYSSYCFVGEDAAKILKTLVYIGRV
jgi:hypothetical protein